MRKVHYFVILIHKQKKNNERNYLTKPSTNSGRIGVEFYSGFHAFLGRNAMFLGAK